MTDIRRFVATPEFSAFKGLKKKKRNLTPFKRPRLHFTPVKNQQERREKDLTKRPYHISDHCLIGTGDEGKVYRVEHQEKGTIAVKVLICKGKNNVKAKFREFFYGNQLQHEGLVKYHDFAFANNELFFEMELCGISLKEKLQQYRVMSEEYDKLFLELLLALQYLHAQGMVHLDVKPSNILVTGNGKEISCKLADFGLMMKNEEWIDDGGSGHYMAPECLNGTFTSPSVDVYSLGVLMMEVMLDVDIGSWDKSLSVIPWEEFDDVYRNSVNEMLLHDASLRPSCTDILTAIQRFEQLADNYGRVITTSPSTHFITPFKDVKISDFVTPTPSPTLSREHPSRFKRVPHETPQKKKFKNSRVTLFSSESPRKILFAD